MHPHSLVSIIVPTKHSSRTLAACLESLQNQSHKNIEIIVVDNFSDDDTQSIAKQYANHVYLQWPERSAQRNFWAQQARGEYICIIDSDMQLSKKVVEQCVEQFEENSQLHALVLPEESFGTWFRAQCKKLERSYYQWISRMEAARCFRKKTFIEFGGYDVENIWTEDFDLPQRIEATYWSKSIWRVEAVTYHNEWVLSLWQTCKKKFYYWQRLDRYTTQESNKKKFHLQASLFQRYKLFFSSSKKILAQPVIRWWMLFMKTVEMIAWWTGYLRGKIRKIDNIY